MPRPLFKFKRIFDKTERTYGLAVRLFGIDICCMLLGWVDDWMLIDWRAPVNRGMSLQLWFLFIGVGRLPDDSIYGS